MSLLSLGVGNTTPVSIITFNAVNNTTNTLNSVSANALLVICAGNNSTSSVPIDCTVSSSPSLIWTKQVDAGALLSDNAEIWTAIFVAGGDITVTTTWAGNEYFSTLFSIKNYEPILAGASGTQTLGTAPSVTLSTTKANSLLFGITADWNGADGASRTYRDGALEAQYYHPSGAITGYVYYVQATAIASHTMGLSSPILQQASTAILEIRGY